MRDTKPMHRPSPRDGTVRIPRRRAGAYQPKDSLGLSCILQDSDENQSLNRRSTLTIPPDNIGISCLPTKDVNLRDASEVAEPEVHKDIILSPRQDRIKKTEEYLLKIRRGADPVSAFNSTINTFNHKASSNHNLKHRVNKQKTVLNNPVRTDLEKVTFSNVRTSLKNKIAQLPDLGISNIRRPRSNSVKPRKPILPKDNIGFCCQLLQKPAMSKTNIGSVEKKSANSSEKKVPVKKMQSAVNVKAKASNTSVTKRHWK